MFKSLLKITVLLVCIFCTASFQTEAATKDVRAPETNDNKETKTAGKIYDLPKDGVTIVLRAPTSGNPQLVKFFKGLSGETQSEILKGLRVSLPKDTSVRFIVDQVNTVLYDVKITVDEGGQQAEVSPKKSDTFPIGEARKALNTARENCRSDTEKKAVNDLADSVEKIGELHKVLNTLLHRSEEASFYNDPVNEFAKIKVDAKTRVETLLKLKIGSSEAIKRYANDVISKTLTAYANQQRVLEHLPKNASDTSNAIAAVFTQTAAKLEAIEKAEWLQKDTQDRLLTEQIKYTCVFIPKESDAKLKATPSLIVTVIRTPSLQGLQVTVGPLISELRDENYMIHNGKIVPENMDRWSKELGVLVHLPLYGRDSRRYRWAFALTGGVPAQIDIADSSVNLKGGPATVGFSLLFAGDESNSLISLTGGIMVKSVKRFKTYSFNDMPLPSQADSSDGLTKQVNRFGLFAAITFSFDVINLVKSVFEKE